MVVLTEQIEIPASYEKLKAWTATWREDPFSVPEEELALWAIVSPNNMLIPPAQERYMDLFTRVFGITREQLTNGPLPDVKLEVQ